MPAARSNPRWRLWATRVALAIAGMAVVAYAAAVSYLWVSQEKLLFAPDVLAANHRFKLDDDVHEVFIGVPGARLHALHMRLPNPRGVVFYLHGNTGSVERWFADADLFRRANFDLFMLDYRGYGKSSGRIASEEELHADVYAVWQAVAERYRGRPVVVYGRSLGTALAATLAARIEPALTILVSPYRSIAALAREHYPWVPGAVLRYPLRTDLVLATLRTPVLLVHGDRDTLIPPAHSQALRALVPQARLVEVEGAGHNDLHTFDAYRRTMAAALEALR